MHDDNSPRRIPGSDVDCDITIHFEPIPVIQDPANPWLPATDWSRDGIIGMDD